MEPYSHSALPFADTIRVLILHPAANLHSDLNASLEVVSIDRESDYTALSYSWGMDGDGDATRCRRILIDKRELAITQNLSDGLRRLRKADEDVRMWIDAVRQPIPLRVLR